jgi:hypothetical protein
MITTENAPELLKKHDFLGVVDLLSMVNSIII